MSKKLSMILIVSLLLLVLVFSFWPVELADAQHKLEVQLVQQPDAKKEVVKDILINQRSAKNDSLKSLVEQVAAQPRTRTIYRTKVRTVIVHDTLFYPTAATEPTDYDIEPTCTTDTVYVHDTVTRRRTLAAWLRGH